MSRGGWRQALALLVGQPRYLFALMLVVPAGFVVTPVIVLVQALRARGQASRRAG